MPGEVYQHIDAVVADQRQRVVVAQIGDVAPVCGVALQLPGEAVSALEDHADGPITMGIRPEHIRPDSPFVDANPGSAIEAGVDVVEPLGSEILVYLTVGEHTLIAKIEPTVMPRVGDTMDAALDLEHVHFFDAETGDSLTD